MAVCKACNQEMLTGAGCVVTFDREKGRMRIPFGNEHWTEHSPALDGPCHDCGVSAGSYHHPGCDMEQCAACGEQRLLCPCEPSPVWMCPLCRSDLERFGVTEMRTGVTCWTVWSRTEGRWDIGEEETGDGDMWFLECRCCGCRLTDAMGRALWDAMDKGWAAA